MATPSSAKLFLNGNDLLEISPHLAAKLCLHETSKHPIDQVLEGAPFTGKVEVHVPLPGQNCREKLETSLFHGLETIAHQILNCSFQGVSRSLFMAAKAVEILSMEIDVFSQSRASKGGISTQEFKRLELARQTLEKDFDHPPSLQQLSRKVGLNDFKLKRGFRLVYHTTVFGYVRHLRMEKARALLEAGDCNVTAAALAAGYSCLGHFTAAFKKHFGFLPSDLLRKSAFR